MARLGHSSSVGAEMNDVRLNHSINPPLPAQRRSSSASSVASSRTRDLRTAQNEGARTARLTQDLIDEEELELNEQEVADAARLMMEGAKAESNRTRVRRELER
jgi:BRCT domain type II-containing protein